MVRELRTEEEEANCFYRRRLGTYERGYEVTDLVRLTDSDEYLRMEKIAELKHEGMNDTAIAKKLGMRRVDVIDLYKDYKAALRNDPEVQERAKDQLNQLIVHYDKLIRKTYELLHELENEPFDQHIAAQRNKNIALIADLEAKRLDMLQKAGILDAADLGDELAEMEEQRDMVLNILRDDLCPACRRTVMEKLSAITNKAEVVVVYDE